MLARPTPPRAAAMDPVTGGGRRAGDSTAPPAPHTGRAGATVGIIGPGANAVMAVAGGPTPPEADSPATGSRRRTSPGQIRLVRAPLPSPGSRGESWSEQARPWAVRGSCRLRDRLRERPPSTLFRAAPLVGGARARWPAAASGARRPAAPSRCPRAFEKIRLKILGSFPRQKCVQRSYRL